MTGSEVVVLVLLAVAAASWPLPEAPTPGRLAKSWVVRRGAVGAGPPRAGAGDGPRCMSWVPWLPWSHRWPHRWRRSDEAGRTAVTPHGLDDSAAADLADLVALGLEAGLSTPQALDLATRTRASARVPRMLDVALELSAELGAPVAPSARAAAVVLRERARAEERAASLAAGPRASMYLLTSLPLVGPLALVVVGLPMNEVFGSPLALGLVGVGALLTGSGWLAARAILRRAGRPTRVVRPPRGGAR